MITLRRWGWLSLAAIFVACGSPKSSSIHPLSLETRVQSLEVALAKKPDLYGIVHLADRKIQIKIRGMVLREWPIQALNVHRAWPEPARREVLIKKGIAEEPERTVVEPPRSPGDDNDTEHIVVEKVEDSLELDDMPEMYTLEFEGSAKILVLSKQSSALGLPNRLYAAGVRVVFWLKRLISPGSPAATLVLDPTDARALYWTLLPNENLIVAAGSVL